MTNPLLIIHQPRDSSMQSNGITVKVTWGPQFGAEKTAGMQRLQKQFDAEVVRRMDPYTPFLTGALKDSAITHTVLGSGKIINATPYARMQYYRLPKGQGIKDGVRGPHWGERFVADNMPQLEAFAKARAAEELK